MTVRSSPARRSSRPAAVLALVLAGLASGARAADLAFVDSEPLSIELPAPEGPPGGSILVDEPAPAVEILENAVVGQPDFIDPVAVSPADDMLLEEFALDEMPYEASSGRWFWTGGWYVGAESMWLDRSRENRQDIVEDIPLGATPRKAIVYTTTGQPFDLSPGARITLGRSLGRDYLGRDRSLEFIYYGGLDYDEDDGWNALADGALYTPLNLSAPGFNGATRYLTSVRSDFNSWEWNYKLRRRLGRDQLMMSPRGNWTRHAERGFLPAFFVGTRLARVTEDFSMTSNRSNLDPPTPESEFGGYYKISTENWLLGLNVGAELISQSEFYYWGLRGRAAPAISFADMSQYAYGRNTTSFGPQGTLDMTDAAQQTAAGFIGDLTLMLGWNITPNFALQIGYDFLWVAGIATSERQFNLDDREFEDIDAGGQTFYQGLSFGCYGSW